LRPKNVTQGKKGNGDAIGEKLPTTQWRGVDRETERLGKVRKKGLDWWERQVAIKKGSGKKKKKIQKTFTQV